MIIPPPGHPQGVQDRPSVTTTAIPRRFAVLALVLWVVAAPFLGPGHALLHGHGDGQDHGHAHHGAEEAAGQGCHDHCHACEDSRSEAALFAFCDVPDCPDPGHHHHERPGSHDGEDHCVTCYASALASPAAPVLLTNVSTPAQLRASRSTPPADSPHGVLGARAPPAART